MEIVKEQSFPHISDIITQLMTTSEPVWIARIGGSDYNFYKFLWDNLECKTKLDKNEIKLFEFHRNNVSFYNGYFDFNDKLSIAYESGQLYIDSLLNSDFTLLLGHEYNEIMKKEFVYTNIVKEYTKDKTHQCCSYSIIEGGLAPEGSQTSGSFFLNSFKIWGNNKKILIVSPFADTIEYQTQPDRINKILNNYEFPNCKFLNYKTPITYNDYNGAKTNYFTNNTKDFNNWIELSNKMVDDISKLDFDIAFISAGGYTMHLGNEIKKMGKKAIYIGGLLNVFFNIYGKRYDNGYYTTIQNLDYRVKAMEDFDDLFDEKTVEKCFTSEALKAYF